MKLKTREWIYTIIIVVLVQFLIQFSAWLYSGNVGALNYISFAGTLISIVLAVLAIIYSYVQSVSQANTTLNITKQVDSLIRATKNIDLSKAQLLNTLDQLAGISEKIDKSIGHQENIDGKVTEIHSKLSASFSTLEQSFGEKNNDKSHSGDSNICRSLEEILSNGTTGVLSVIICIYYGYRLGFGRDKIKDELSVPSVEVVFQDMDESFVKAYQRAFFHGVTTSLDSIGILKFDHSDLIVIEDQFLILIEEYVKELDASSYEHDHNEPLLTLSAKKFCEEYVKRMNVNFFD